MVLVTRLPFLLNRKGSLVTRTMRFHVARVQCARLNSLLGSPFHHFTGYVITRVVTLAILR